MSTPASEGEFITEYAMQMAGGGWQTWNTDPEILAIYPLAEHIANAQRYGGKVYRREILVVKDWIKVRKGSKR